MKATVEPRFLGVPCDGPNKDRSASLKTQAEAYLLLSDFYALAREDQLLMAALVTEMITKRD